tara:strand:+ start:118 stop:1671 length:1554 start_codon:yes stop_codon:yes gene_type:complete
MPTLGRDFLQALTNPPLNEGLFNLGSAIGGMPGQYKAQKREEKTQEQFKLSTGATEEGVIAAQKGDLVNLDSQINNLRTLANNPALTTKQREDISRRIIDLSKLRTGTKELNENNQTKELINLNKQIKDPNLPDNEKVKVQARIDEIRKNPNIISKWQQHQLNTWKFETEKKDLEAEQWLDKNMSTINKLIEEEDDEGLDNFIKNAGEYTDDAQVFATSALKYREARIQFKEQRYDKRRAPNNLDLYNQQIDLLPEELKESLGPIHDAYKQAAEKWNAQTETWDGGIASRITASRLEDQLQKRIIAAQNATATAAFNDTRSEKNLIKKQLFTAKLSLETASALTPADTRNARVNVAARYANLKDKDKPKREAFMAEVAEEEQRIVRERVRAATEVVYYLENYGEEEPADEGDKPAEATQANIEISEKWNSKDYEDFTTEENALINSSVDRYNLSKTQTIRVLLRGGKLSLPKEITTEEEPKKWDMRRASGFVNKMENLGTREERMAKLRERRANINE